jgi:glycosyltransferase involved in cell wall biosynthesis
MAQRILISVTSDLATDQRVNRAATTLKEAGYRVLVIGRVLKTSPEVSPKRYRTLRFKLWAEKGPMFYALFILRLFWFLLWHHADILFCNDLDALPANFLAAKLKKVPLVYDSHEYFTGVPELIHRPKVQRIWKKIERYCLPKVDYAITVNESIARLYFEEYQKNFEVIRNVPIITKPFLGEKTNLRNELGLPQNKNIVILQGAGINIDRGAEELVQSMMYLPDYLLLIVGGGDVLPALKKIVSENNLKENVWFIAKQPIETLRKYTAASSIGVTLDKDNNINYKFSLPNKIFDYIHAGIPVLASDLPEISKIINEYKIGKICPDHNPKTIANCIDEMIKSEEKMKEWEANTTIAAKDFNWDKEKEKLLAIFKKIG